MAHGVRNRRAPRRRLNASGNGLSGQRADGAEAPAQLLLSALKLFAEKGFAKTSTREMAQAAGANLAAISDYFGDKAGLYIRRKVAVAPELPAQTASIANVPVSQGRAQGAWRILRTSALVE